MKRDGKSRMIEATGYGSANPEVDPATRARRLLLGMGGMLCRPGESRVKPGETYRFWWVTRQLAGAYTFALVAG